MSKVLFTHSYFYKLDPKQWRFKQPYPPLGTIQAAAVIRDDGFEVSLFDTCLADSPNQIISVIESENPDFLVIYDDGFNYLTKMCLTNMREAAFQLSRIGKEMGCKVIVCSSDAADHYEKYLNNGADFVIIGEGELTLLELLQYLDINDYNFDRIRGIAFRTKGNTIITSRRNVLNDLDFFPMPAWDLIKINTYKKIWRENHGYFSINVATTRGCPYKCNWCAKPIYGNRYNSRSPEHVIEEIDYLIREFKPDHFWFCDDIFGLKPGWVQRFKNLVNENNLRFKFKIQSRVDLLLEEDNIDALADSGLETVWVGAESGSQHVLDAMDKGTKVAEIYRATGLLKQRNIRVGFFLQFGYLGETKKDIKSTIKMVKDLLPDEIGISVSYPLPGTKFYEKVKQDLIEKTNWTDSNEMAMMFTGTYPPEYYKILYFYVHKVYRTHLGVKNIASILKKPWILRRKQLKSALSAFYYFVTSLYDVYRLKRLENKQDGRVFQEY